MTGRSDNTITPFATAPVPGDDCAFSIVFLFPPGYAYKNCTDDIVIPLRYALQRLGYEARIQENSFAATGMNIIFGLQDVPNIDLDTIPPNSVIYNFEQLVGGSKALRPHYLAALRRFPVWEYSERNYAVLRGQYNIASVSYVPLGYVPEMSRLDPEYPQDIDVLLYGSLNERRQNIIKALSRRGVRAAGAEKIFGAERDFLIARSKIVINVHYFVPAILEIARLGYLFANRKPVVSERGEDTEIHPGLEESCLFAPYGGLVEKTVELLHAPKSRKLLGERGFLAFSAMPYEEILADVLDKMGISNSAEDTQGRKGLRALPRLLNAGSGKDFRPDALNVDISPQWNPDLVLDLSLPLDCSARYACKRFGTFSFSPGMFTRIRAFDMLEHVADVPQTMKNFLDLLRDGGELSLNVPYDLSLGAWQDPTHRHAFNENSWLYYTTWAWYLGWREWRFTLRRLDYTFSEYGRKLQESGTVEKDILSSPRAVEFMTVHLIKCKSTPEEIVKYEMKHRAFYKDSAGEWTV
jgi:SAM-dependent methyltransferase